MFFFNFKILIKILSMEKVSRWFQFTLMLIEDILDLWFTESIHILVNLKLCWKISLPKHALIFFIYLFYILYVFITCLYVMFDQSSTLSLLWVYMCNFCLPLDLIFVNRILMVSISIGILLHVLINIRIFRWASRCFQKAHG